MTYRAILLTCVLGICGLAGSQDMAVHQEKPSASSNPYIDPAWVKADPDQAAELGACKLEVLRAYFWRDWMPIVAKPGPDGGSPLRARITLWLDNGKGQTVRPAFKAAFVDAKGQRYPAAFQILPNYRLLPVEVDKALFDYSEDDRRNALAKYRVNWDGVLYAGETRVVEISTGEGPYFVAKSPVRVEITWTDPTGKTATIKTPLQFIVRTD